MIKKHMCCANPIYEVIDRFYTYEKEKNTYKSNFYTTNITTTITIPQEIINNIVKESKNATIDEIKQIIADNLNNIVINTNNKRKSYIEIQKCKNCGYIKKVEVKLC